MAARGGPQLPGHLLRRVLLRQMASFDGSGGKPAKADVNDLRAMIDAAGWPLETRASSGYGATGFPERVDETGEVPRVCVNYLVRAYEDVVGELADDDPVWTVAKHLHEHSVLFVPPKDGGPTLAQRVHESWHPTDGSPGGPLRLGRGHGVPGPRHEEALAIVLGWIARGVLEQLTPAQVASEAECKAISVLLVIFKGALQLPADVLAAIASGDEVGVATGSEALAAELVAEVRARHAAHPGERPSESLEFVLAARRGPEAKSRMVHDGHALGAYVHTASFAYSGLPEVLHDFIVGDLVGKMDASSFFYVVEYAAESRPYLCVEFPGLGVLRYRRLSMGMRDSPLLASLLSTLVCVVARARGHSLDVHAYMDDWMWRVRQGEDPAAMCGTLATILEGANVAEAAAKRVVPVPAGPNTELLGLELNSPKGLLVLPLRKRAQYMVHAAVVRLLLADDVLRNAVTKPSLASLAGKLGWWCCAASYARPHLGGLITAAKPDTRVEQFAAAVVADLTWWRDRCVTGTLKGEVILGLGASSLVQLCGGKLDAEGGVRGGRPAAVVTSDAGEPGAGAVCDGKAVHMPFTAEERKRSSAWREARVAVEAFRRFGPSWRGRCVLLLTDNRGNVFTFMKGSTGRSSPAADALLRELYALGEQHGFTWVCTWIPREVNLAADALSKCADAAAAAKVCAQRELELVAAP